MKNLKLLSKKLLVITLILFASFKVYSSDKPVDIWKENEKKMLKYLTYELDKDDRDYRRFFQSRNVSLSSFSKFRNLNNDKRVSGRKNKINENSFFPIIAKKMLKI